MTPAAITGTHVMARNTGGAKGWAFVSTVVAAIALGALGILLFQTKFDRYARLPEFPVESYLEGKGMWSGDFFRIVGTVENVLHQNEEDGILVVSVQMEEAGRIVPVLVTRKENQAPLSRNQQLKMEVAVDPNDRIKCLRYDKK
jgi:hypothetical protein